MVGCPPAIGKGIEITERKALTVAAFACCFETITLGLTALVSADVLSRGNIHWTKTMLRYAIRSRASFSGDESEQQAALLRQAFHWVRDGFDYIQLREKDLSSDSLAALASEILEAIAATPTPTRLLINSRAEIAIQIRAHGVHRRPRPQELTPAEVRGLYASANLPRADGERLLPQPH